MNAIIIGLDRSLFNENSESSQRILGYGNLVGRLDIVVFTQKGFEPKKFGQNLTVYPTNSSAKIFYFWDGFKLVKKIKGGNKIDCLITQDAFFIGLFGLLTAKMIKAKLAVSVFGTNVFNPYWLKSSPFKHTILKLLALFVFKRADAIQTDGVESYKMLKSKYGSKVFHKPLFSRNILDYSIYRHEEKKFTGDGLKLLLVARLVKQKNITLAIEVMRKIKELVRGRKVTLTIAGDGPEKSRLQALTEKEGLNERVFFAGSQEKEGLKQLYLEHDALLMTSSYEGYPRVFMEAAALGLPVITTEVDGCHEFIEDGQNGFIATQQAALEPLADGIRQFAENQRLLSDFSRKIKKNFWQKMDLDVTYKVQKEIFDYLGQEITTKKQDTNKFQ